LLKPETLTLKIVQKSWACQCIDALLTKLRMLLNP